MNTIRAPLRKAGVVTLAALGATIATWVVHGQIHPHTGLPSVTYDLVVRDFSFETGDPIQTTRVFRALRDDGSYVEVRSQQGESGARYESRAIEDLQSLKRSIVVPSLGVVTSVPLTREYADGIRSRGKTECVGPSGAPRATVLGVETFIIEQEGVEMIRPGSKSWLAPALGCIPLRVEWRTGGKVIRTEEVENLARVRPEASLFDVPSGFVEVSPGEAMSRLHAELGTPAYDASSHIERIVEEQYAKRRRAAGL